MRHRRIGGAGFLVGAVGLCCAGLSQRAGGSTAQGTQPRADVVPHALDRGMTLLSLSDATVADELLVGRALEGRRDSAVLSTGVGLVPQADGRTVRRADPDHVRTAIEHSLRRLRTDHVDVYVLVAVDPQVPVEDTWAAMAGLVAAGHARSLGVATADQRLLARLQSVFPVTVVVAPASLAALPGALSRWCADRGVGLLATGPLAGGALAGGGPPVAGVPGPLRAAVAEVAARHRVAPATVALAALLAAGDTVVPLPATSRPEHLDALATAADLDLDGEDLDLLADASP